MAKKARGIITTCKSYMFKTKDPAIDEVRTLVQDEYGKLDYGTLEEIKQGGGPSVGCMAGWFFGDTRRPNNQTLEAAGRTIGYKRVWQRLKK